MTHSSCNRCIDPLTNTKGPCIMSFHISAPDPSVPEKEEISMAKGHHFVKDGKVYRTTTPEAKKLLKAVIRGEAAKPRDEDEIAPVIDLDKLDKEAATQAFLLIEMGE